MIAHTVSIRYILISSLLMTDWAFSLPNFPGTQGWGTQTKGGRGGKVLIVSNLNSSGPGSFAAAMNTTGPRIIVFRVSGFIENAGVANLTEAHSYVTVAGQTSPGGITLKTTTGMTCPAKWKSPENY